VTFRTIPRFYRVGLVAGKDKHALQPLNRFEKLIHLYEAKTSPQMVVINPRGIEIYSGAIDDKPTTDVQDIPNATNYVSLALEEAMAGKHVQTPATRPYGCSVKYTDSRH